jgi:hypothetical protein
VLVLETVPGPMPTPHLSCHLLQHLLAVDRSTAELTVTLDAQLAAAAEGESTLHPSKQLSLTLSDLVVQAVVPVQPEEAVMDVGRTDNTLRDHKTRDSNVSFSGRESTIPLSNRPVSTLRNTTIFPSRHLEATYPMLSLTSQYA